MTDRIILVCATLMLVACSRAPEPSVATIAAPAATIGEAVEEYYERYLELNPLEGTFAGDMRFNDRLPNSLSETWLADSLALEQEYLERVEAIEAGPLSDADRLTREIFLYDRALAVAGFAFPTELLPIDQLRSLPILMAQLASGSSVQPFATTLDYDNWLRRLDGLVVWMDQAIANMRRGMEKSIVQPAIVVQKILPQLAALTVDDPAQSIFHRPVEQFPDAVPAEERERLEAAYRATIAEKLIPAYRRLHDFLRDEYLPAARASVGFSALPNGTAWYTHYVRYWTTTELDPERIHRVGLTEVARIRAEMEQVVAALGFAGDLSAFFEHLRTDPRVSFETPEQLLESYAALRERVAQSVPALFSLVPGTGFDIRAVEPFREKSAPPASYQPGTPDGSRPGIFYVNTYDVTARPRYLTESLYLHEAVPGHHFQLMLQRERADLPRFRRYGDYGAYSEGWGLYAESLGPELGLYQDPYQHFGALTGEMFRAIRLVVDTGLHWKGWTREQAIQYARDNSSLGEQDIVAEVERYIAVPGQALAYKIGALKIRELRSRAEQALGPRFDVRDFHTQVLEDGSLPLAVLETKIARWIEQQGESQAGMSPSVMTDVSPAAEPQGNAQ